MSIQSDIDSLFSTTIEYIANNLSIYEKSSLHLFHTLPPAIKNRLLKKVTSTSYFLRNVKFTNFLSAFVNNSTTQVNLTSVYVSDEMLDILCSCKNLRRLYLTRDGSNCKVSTQGLIHLLQNTPKLENLIIMRCDQVTDEVLECVSSSCKKLLGLDIGGCVQVTDNGLKFLSSMEIYWLRISRTQITDDGITALVQGKCGQTLTEISIDNCVNVTQIGLNAITKNCPNITMFNFINCNTDVLATDFLTFKQAPKQLFWQISF